MFAVDSDDDEEDDVPDEFVKILLDFFNETPLCDAEEEWGQSGFSRHSSGLSDEKSARIPLSVLYDIIL